MIINLIQQSDLANILFFANTCKALLQKKSQINVYYSMLDVVVFIYKLFL